MMSWNNNIFAFLIVFLSTIDVSQGGCNDYFSMMNLGKNLSTIIPIVKTENPKDTMECSVEKAFLENPNKLPKPGNGIGLLKCFKRKIPDRISDKCKGETFLNVTFYHFMCLTAKALKLTADDIGHTGCEYDSVLPIYSDISKGFGQTTTLSTTTTTAPTTTLPERTTASSTTTATTTAAATTTTTTALSPTTKTTTTADTQSAFSGNTALASQLKVDEKTSNTESFRTVLIISLMLNLVLPLAVYLYMRNHRSQDYELPANTEKCELDEVSADQSVAEMEPSSQPASVNRDVEEAEHLMQASECDSVVTL